MTMYSDEALREEFIVMAKLERELKNAEAEL